MYELLDETMDFGYPQTCESRILREYVNDQIIINKHEYIYISLFMTSLEIVNLYIYLYK